MDYRLTSAHPSRELPYAGNLGLQLRFGLFKLCTLTLVDVAIDDSHEP
jgi:hypothetical protein